ncbi:carboxypeptidase-like regulatory domain-containing protein [Sphingobacterium sp. DN00404]|uniref:Carboxypeptidase-like regulatory domain-containing protein n=1 Tax=Sphingobacterium micropteri TaxID=2763501 RepID=A0ABR7YVB5_9SPHI|nr:carboxypeptidase-like regulatory domain-containing protein [Sphingobacterium micropteri]MBD1435201.1 carboxypeptidase-like regulatory domain-containing protein [Sphingobacterium micropteri]
MKLKAIIYCQMFMLLSILPNLIQAQSGIRGGLNGVVSDADGRPIAGAIIQLEPDLHQAQTDEKGSFQFKNIIAGNYTLKTSYLGYHAYSTKIKIEVGQRNTLSIELERNETSLETVEVKGKVTAVDNLLDIQRSAMPVTVISKETIALMGSRRLDEVLREQTGMAVVNDIGGGVELQLKLGDFFMLPFFLFPIASLRSA